MKFYAGLIKKSFAARLGIFIICIAVTYLFIGIEVKAQSPPPCVGYTPFCPCLLENGDCFDIDTPIDNSVLLLLLSGLLVGLYKLQARKLN